MRAIASYPAWAISLPLFNWSLGPKDTLLPKGYDDADVLPIEVCSTLHALSDGLCKIEGYKANYESWKQDDA
jgi:hypothetical protein